VYTSQYDFDDIVLYKSSVDVSIYVDMQVSTATVSAVEADTSRIDVSRIDDLVVSLSTTTQTIMSSVTALEHTGSSLIYMDPDATSYATSMKDSRGLLNEQTNVCKVGHPISLLFV